LEATVLDIVVVVMCLPKMASYKDADVTREIISFGKNGNTERKLSFE
jgi:hypothetical protein